MSVLWDFSGRLRTESPERKKRNILQLEWQAEDRHDEAVDHERGLARASREHGLVSSHLCIHASVGADDVGLPTVSPLDHGTS